MDDGSKDDTGAQAAAAGATVVRHPYNKGNGAAVKSGIRRATGEYVLIIDGDGQHTPEDARRLVARLGEYDLVIGARSTAHAGDACAALRQRRAQLAGQLSDRPRDPGPDVRLPRPPAASTCASSCTCCRTASRRRRRRRWRSSRPATTWRSSRSRRGSASGKSKIRLARDGAKFLLIILKIVTLFSPLRVFLPISMRCVRARRSATRCGRSSTQSHVTNSSVLLIMLVGHRVPRRPGLRADLGAAIRRPAVDRRMDSTPAAARLIVAAAVAGSRRCAGVRLRLLDDKPLTHDEREYLALAQSLAAGRGFTYPRRRTRSARRQQFGRAPGYPVFLVAASARAPATSQRTRPRQGRAGDPRRHRSCG